MDGRSSATASPQSPARACALAERDGQRGKSWMTAGGRERKGDAVGSRDGVRGDCRQKGWIGRML